MPRKTALITGVTGQDGAFLSEFLLEKGYIVYGIKRKSSSYNTSRIDHLVDDPLLGKNFKLKYGDLTDPASLVNIINEVQPDEIYNLGAQSHVAVSFELPGYTASVDALGLLHLLEAVRFLKLGNKTRIYQAGTSELFGDVLSTPQNEFTPFNPQSPYAVAKLYAHWIALCYRKSYGMFVANGILFNHESSIRGETFVTRKITIGLSSVLSGKVRSISLGNINAKRDWGHAKDYVEAQWLMLQQKTPGDFVIATGINYSVRDFINSACSILGINIIWSGNGLDEKGVITSINNSKIKKLRVGDVLFNIDKKYFRPAEVETLLGDPTNAKKILNWQPKLGFHDIVKEMVTADVGAFI
jgi:GDPmannose 4,6-dehydratase